jgi:hypothetical protein
VGRMAVGVRVSLGALNAPLRRAPWYRTGTCHLCYVGMRVTLARAALVGAAVLCLPAAAVSRMRLEMELPASQVNLRGDGQRFAAWTPAHNQYPAEGTRYSYLRDSRTRRTRKYEPPSGCRLGDIAAGVGILRCGDRGGTLGIPRRLVVLKTREIFRLKTSRRDRTWLAEAAVVGFGRHWIRMARCPGFDRPCKYGYVNWRTGEVRRPRQRQDSGPPNPPFDLDSPRLRPYARKVPRIYYGSSFDAAGLNLALRGRVVKLSRCRESCNYPQLGSGLATWASTRAAFGYRPSDGQRFRWDFAELTDQPPNELSGLTPVHTAHEVLFEVPVQEADGTNPRIRVYIDRRP